MDKIIILGIIIAGGLATAGALAWLWTKLDDSLDDGHDDNDDDYNNIGIC